MRWRQKNQNYENLKKNEKTLRKKEYSTKLESLAETSLTKRRRYENERLSRRSAEDDDDNKEDEGPSVQPERRSIRVALPSRRVIESMETGAGLLCSSPPLHRALPVTI